MIPNNSSLNSHDPLTHQTRLWGVLLISFQLLTFAFGSYLWCARTSWIVLAILFVLDIKYALYSIFFFAAFFRPTDFFIHLPLTIKHFHLAFFLALVVRTMRGESLKDLQNAYKYGHLFFSFLPILLIGGINLFFYPSHEALRTLLNLTFVWSMMFYTFGMIERHLANNKNGSVIFQRAISFFVWGVIAQTLIGFFNIYTGQNLLSMSLLHDNHLGFLCSITLFYAFHHNVIKNRWWKTFLSIGATLIIFSGLFASLSRTAWLSFVFSFFIYLFIIQTRRQSCKTENVRRVFFRYVLMLFLLLGMVLCAANQTIMERAVNLPQILDLNYLNFTLHDTQNFGFLGSYRLRDLTALREIFLQSPGLGLGFLRNIVDMHGFLWVILGSTGLTGFAFFCLFVGRILQVLWKTIWSENDLSSIYLAAATFASITVWLCASFLETYFLQFFIWLQIAIANMIVTREFSSHHST